VAPTWVCAVSAHRWSRLRQLFALDLPIPRSLCQAEPALGLYRAFSSVRSPRSALRNVRSSCSLRRTTSYPYAPKRYQLCKPTTAILRLRCAPTINRHNKSRLYPTHLDSPYSCSGGGASIVRRPTGSVQDMTQTKQERQREYLSVSSRGRNPTNLRDGVSKLTGGWFG
jgi:hypothetical protein